MTYEYMLAYEKQVNTLLEKGWEPVPHTVPVIAHALNTPMSYVFLRRAK